MIRARIRIPPSTKCVTFWYFCCPLSLFFLHPKIRHLKGSHCILPCGGEHWMKKKIPFILNGDVWYILSFASLSTTKPKMWPLTDKLTFHHEIATGRTRELGHSSACHQGLCYRKYAVSFSVISLVLFGMKALAQMILPGLPIPVLTFGRSTWITVMKKKIYSVCCLNDPK